ncbi:antifreeze protein [Mycena latifolia]|nr:antifreeze protein [Mycena latifolia]
MISTVFTISFLTALSTVCALGPAAVNLRTAANYIIFSTSGVSVLAPCAISIQPNRSQRNNRFSLILDSTGQFATSSQVVGKIFSASYAPPTPFTLTVTIGDMGTAVTDAINRPSPNFTNLASGAIGGLVLVPGLYKWTSAVTAASNITISGAATDTWIFQVTGTLNVAANAKMLLAGGALAKNIVWVVTGAVTAGARSQLEGVILGRTSITLLTGATAHGRLLSQGSVLLQQATVTLN